VGCFGVERRGGSYREYACHRRLMDVGISKDCSILLQTPSISSFLYRTYVPLRYRLTGSRTNSGDRLRCLSKIFEYYADHVISVRTWISGVI
jgi:hypothetical protein